MKKHFVIETIHGPGSMKKSCIKVTGDLPLNTVLHNEDLIRKGMRLMKKDVDIEIICEGVKHPLVFTKGDGFVSLLFQWKKAMLEDENYELASEIRDFADGL